MTVSQRCRAGMGVTMIWAVIGGTVTNWFIAKRLFEIQLAGQVDINQSGTKGLAIIANLNPHSHLTGSQMAKTNYTFEKRQKELAKKKKQEEKRLKKTAAKEEQPQDGASQPPADEAAVHYTKRR